MDDSAWIGLAILIGVILILWYVNKASMSNSNKLGKLFDRITKEKKMHINERAGWDNGIVGLDIEKKVIAYVQQSNSLLEHSIFYLNSIKSCEVLHEKTTEYARIILKFDYGSEDMKPIEICFYDSRVDLLANMTELKKKADHFKESVYKAMKTNNT